MQYIAIKEEIKDEKKYYVISAIPLKNVNNDVIQKIPHPLGSDVLVYASLEEAKDAIMRAGFSYVLPDGKKGDAKKNSVKVSKIQKKEDYSQFVWRIIREKVDSSNSNVVASALVALAEFPISETFDVLFQKIGEDNDVIRKNAIAGICRYGKLLQDKLIDELKSSNWVVRNSVLTCIQNLIESNSIEADKFILPLSECCNDVNTIVQSNAILTLAKVYQSYKKNN